MCKLLLSSTCEAFLVPILPGAICRDIYTTTIIMAGVDLNCIHLFCTPGINRLCPLRLCYESVTYTVSDDVVASYLLPHKTILYTVIYNLMENIRNSVQLVLSS